MLDPLLNLLFPLTCVVCSDPVKRRAYGAACLACWARLLPIPEPTCMQCGTPAPAIEGLCGRCRLNEYAFDTARSLFLYNDTLRTIIHHLKYEDRVSLAVPLGQLLRRLVAAWPGVPLVPVPMHASRERKRGYNQAELIAGHAGAVSRKLVRRRKATASQTGLTRDQRERNLAGAFEVRGPVPSHVIVVDDVFTTGSTVSAVAHALKRAGATRVDVITVGRVANDLIDGPEFQTEAEVFSGWR